MNGEEQFISRVCGCLDNTRSALLPKELADVLIEYSVPEEKARKIAEDISVEYNQGLITLINVLNFLQGILWSDYDNIV